MKWRDIPKIEQWGRSFTVPWNDLAGQLANYEIEVGLDIDPDFQRGHVWTQPQQIKYVEYILRDGSLNRHIIFNCPGFMCPTADAVEGRMLLIDRRARRKPLALDTGKSRQRFQPP